MNKPNKQLVRAYNSGVRTSLKITGEGGGKKGGGGGTSETPNTLRSKATARLLDLLGEGEIEGLVGGAKGIYLDNTPLQNQDGTFNFTGITWDIRYGTPDQEPMSGFSAIETELAVGTEFTHLATAQLFTPADVNIQLDIITLMGHGLITGDGPFQFQSTGSLPTGIVGKTDYWIIRVDGDTIKIANSHTNALALVAVDIKSKGQANAEGVAADPTYKSHSFGSLFSIIRVISNTEVDAVRVTIRVPALFKQSEGNVTASSVEIKIQLQPTGESYFTVVRDTISGKNTAPYERAYRIGLRARDYINNGSGSPIIPPATLNAPFNIRVSRVTRDGVSDIDGQDKTIWQSYTELIDHKLIYPNSAYVGMVIDSQQFGGRVPSRSYKVRGIKIQVPSNYDPTTRIYNGIWDGTFQTAWSDNPAWVLYDILTNTVYGCGRDISPDNVATDALYVIGKYCDELVPDGFGGMEPRFTFNGWINSSEEAYAVIQSITSNFRAMTYWATGTVVTIQDSPRDADSLLAPANVDGGMFNYQGTELKERHSMVFVNWNNPTDHYRKDVEVVEDPIAFMNYGFRDIGIISPFTTSRGQARRWGRWQLETEQNQTETTNYRGTFDQFWIRPGNVIKIADPTIANIRFGGRILIGGTTSITIDSAVLLSQLAVYALSIVMPDGSIEERALTNAPDGETPQNILTWTLPLSTSVLPGAIWVIATDVVEPREFRIIGAVESEKNLLEFVGLLHDPHKYDRVELGLTFPATSYSTFPTGPLHPPTNLDYKEFSYTSGGNVLAAVTLSWVSHDARAIFYEFEYKSPDSIEWVRDPRNITTNSVRVDNVTEGLWGFRVRAVDGIQRRSTWETIDPVGLFGLDTPISDVQNFRLIMVGQSIQLAWDAVSDLILDYYVIRYNQLFEDPSWGDSQIAVEHIPRGVNTIMIPARIGSFLIKAFTAAGLESPNAAIVTSGQDTSNAINIVAFITESPDFAGTHDRTISMQGELKLDVEGNVLDIPDVLTETNFLFGVDPTYVNQGYYYFANNFDLGDVFSSRLTITLETTGEDISFNFLTVVNVLELSDFYADNPSTYKVIGEVRTTSDDPSGMPTWSEWGPFGVGEYICRAFEFRLNLQSLEANITPVVFTTIVKIDMQDRVEADLNLDCPITGLDVIFSAPFKVTPSTVITSHNLETGDYAVLTDKTTSGFHVEFFDSTNTPIARIFDYVSKGYGRVLS